MFGSAHSNNATFITHVLCDVLVKQHYIFYIILNGLSFYRLNCAVDGMIDFSFTNA